ncbi:hypothetical protein CR513_48052, partial [Mucuna pruriens]
MLAISHRKRSDLASPYQHKRPFIFVWRQHISNSEGKWFQKTYFVAKRKKTVCDELHGTRSEIRASSVPRQKRRTKSHHGSVKIKLHQHILQLIPSNNNRISRALTTVNKP